MGKIILKKNEEHRIRNGHLWIFSNEIEHKDAQNGEIIEVLDFKGKLLGHGFYNEHSLIAVRLLAGYYNGNFRDYVIESLHKALQLRAAFYPKRISFRLTHSESDYLPGLIIDRYNSTYVLQVYCTGIEQRINMIIEILKTEFKAENIFTLNDPHFRKLEGLPENDIIYLGNIREEVIDDGQLKYKIDFSHSQKTGFYFDQCDNRKYIEKLCKDKKVLDVFCNSGGFGLHAAHAGASWITFADSSKNSLDNAYFNFKLNGFKTPVEFICKDAFDLLEELKISASKYDLVIVDPPSFAKSKKNLQKALKGYEKLNRLAMAAVSGGGFLVSSSCSGHVSRGDFYKTIIEAGRKSARKLQMVYFTGAAHDHPVIPAMPETSYLKFAVFRVM